MNNSSSANSVERVYEGEIVESPWQSTEAGCPVFVSKSYDEHEGEWISKEQEGNAILWEMAAIAYSLVGMSSRERDTQGQVKQFAGVVKTTARRIQQLAGAYSLRLEAEVEERSRFRPLTEGLTVAHWSVAAEQVFNRAETNAAECGEWLEKAADEGWSAAEMKRQIVAAKRAALESGEWPDGVYRIIYADPPWEYSDRRSGLESYGPAEKHYPTMSVEELRELPVSSLAGENCVLFLWATSPLLPDALEIIEAWDFEYKSSFVWDKVGHNYGHYNSVRHEFLLIATKGSCLPDSSELRDSVITVDKSSIHSEKPPAFREMIDGLYTRGPRIELFLRGDAPDGWTGWGNEAIQKAVS